MFDSLFQDDTDRALRFEAATPRVQPKKEPGLLDGVGSGFVAGLQQGALETARVGINAAVAAYRLSEFSPGDGVDTFADLAKKGEPDLAKRLGKASRDWDPDPETVSMAGQIVQGFARVGGKAIGSVMVGGPAAGVAALGVNEGATEGLKLADQGVDPTTALQAGVVKGALTAAGAALPIAGTTAAATAGLVVAGGPVAFMTEQAAIREILRNADYDAVAAQYDPFDTVGLVASLAAPAAFGAAAHALRVKPQAELAPIRPPEEVVDAARVALLDQHDLDVIQGRAKAEGKPIVEAMAEQPAGRQAAAERIEKGEPAVPRETAPATPEPVEAVAAPNEAAAVAAVKPPEAPVDVPVMKFDSRGDLIEAGTAPREEVAKGWRVQKVLLEQLRECLGA
jgi:hypothetical protein